ncbi:MAG: Nucleoside phosphorylase, partial [Candidatus Wolfebacteria bacterium GW2011_GWB1_41_12]
MSRIVRVASLFGLVTVLSAACAPPAAPRIALISAFGAELETFRAEAEIEKEVIVNGRTVYLGTLAGHDVLMTESGVSMTNAAMTTQVLLDRFNVTHIVFSGIAGGVNPVLLVGDVAVPARWAATASRALPSWTTQPTGNTSGTPGRPMRWTWRARLLRMWRQSTAFLSLSFGASPILRGADRERTKSG